MRTELRQVAHTVVARAVLMVLGALSGVVIARELQPEGRGAYYVIATIATITISVGHLSVEQAHVWLWSRAADPRSLAANSLVLGLVVGALAALAAAVIVGVAGAGRGAGGRVRAARRGARRDPLRDGRAVPEQHPRPALRGPGGEPRRAARRRAAVRGAAGPGVVSRLSPAVVIALWAVSVSVPLLVLLAAVRPRLRHWDGSLARTAVGRGLRYHVGLASLFLLFRSDILILDGLTTTAAVGLYSLAVSLAELTRLVTDAIAQIALPRQLNTDDDGAAAATVSVTRLTTIVALVSVGLMCAAAPPLIPVVYGSSFAGSVPSLLALAPGLLALGATRPIGAYLLRLDRPMLGSAMAVAALLVNIALNLVLVPDYGILGSAVASSVAYTGAGRPAERLVRPRHRHARPCAAARPARRARYVARPVPRLSGRPDRAKTYSLQPRPPAQVFR